MENIGSKNGQVCILFSGLVIATMGLTRAGIAPNLSSNSYWILLATTATTTFSPKSCSGSFLSRRFIECLGHCTRSDHINRPLNFSMQMRFLVLLPFGRILSVPDVVT